MNRIDRFCRQHDTTAEALRGVRRSDTPLRKEYIRERYSEGAGAAQIGREINKDHTTIIYHIRRMKL